MKTGLVLLVVSVVMCFASVGFAQFEERDGLVIMEMESVSLPQDAQWIKEDQLSGYKGSGYYRFTGNGICNGPASSPLRYDFRVTTGGRYELRLRAAKILHCVKGTPHNNNQCDEQDRTCTSLGQPNGDQCGGPDECIRSDISNDAFVYIEDDQGNHIKFVDQPHDTKPIKLFGGRPNEWAWTGKRALDTAGKKWNAHWDLSPGAYTLVVSGRSQSFRIDRMVFFIDGQGNPNMANDREETLASMMMPDMGFDMAADMASDLSDMTPIADMMGQNDMRVVDMPADTSASQDMSGDLSDMVPMPGLKSGDEDGCASTKSQPVSWGVFLMVLVGWCLRRKRRLN